MRIFANPVLATSRSQRASGRAGTRTRRRRRRWFQAGARLQVATSAILAIIIMHRKQTNRYCCKRNTTKTLVLNVFPIPGLIGGGSAKRLVAPSRHLERMLENRGEVRALECYLLMLYFCLKNMILC